MVLPPFNQTRDAHEKGSTLFQRMTLNIANVMLQCVVLVASASNEFPKCGSVILYSFDDRPLAAHRRVAQRELTRDGARDPANSHLRSVCLYENNVAHLLYLSLQTPACWRVDSEGALLLMLAKTLSDNLLAGLELLRQMVRNPGEFSRIADQFPMIAPNFDYFNIRTQSPASSRAVLG